MNIKVHEYKYSECCTGKAPPCCRGHYYNITPAIIQTEREHRKTQNGRNSIGGGFVGGCAKESAGNFPWGEIMGVRVSLAILTTDEMIQMSKQK